MNLAHLSRLVAGYDAGDPRRIHHLLKVYALCRLIGQAEGLPDAAQARLEAAALVHDIGIHESERKYGFNNGPLQEEEGPAVARPLLEQAGATPEEIQDICWLVAHHHTYTASESLPFRILLEADFLVNAYEDGLPPASCAAARERLFRTETGRAYLDALCLAPPYEIH